MSTTASMVNKERAVDIVYLDCRKTSNTVSLNILIDELFWQPSVLRVYWKLEVIVGNFLLLGSKTEDASQIFFLPWDTMCKDRPALLNLYTS